MDWTAVIEGITAIATAGAIALAFYVKSTVQTQIDDAIREQGEGGESLRNQVVDHDRRLIKVEEAIKFLPQQRDFARLNDHVAELAGDMKRMVAEIHALGQGQERTETAIGVINETLMQGQINRQQR